MRSASFLIVSLLASAGAAQHGPRLGVGLATQSANGLFSNTQDMLPAPLAGWHVEIPLHAQMSVMPELLWMTKGSLVRNPAQGARTRLALNYLELPVLLKVSLGRQADGMYLLAGPSAGLFLSGRQQNWLNGQLISNEPYALQPGQQRIQFSALAGLGMEGPRWGFDARAQSSLTPFGQLVRVQSMVYALTVARRFGVKPPEPIDTGKPAEAP
jgi:hypothetical protein